MDFKKFSDDASGFFNRTIQRTEEAFKTSEVVVLDANLENLKRQVDQRKRWVTSFINLAGAVAQPNPASRMEDQINKTLDRSKKVITEEGKFGASLTSVGEQLGATSPHGSALIAFGKAELTIGEGVQQMQQSIRDRYIQPMQDYISHCVTPCEEKIKDLEAARLDLGRAKTGLKRAGTDAEKKAKQEQLHTSAQKKFDDQCVDTKSSMEKCISEFDQLQSLSKAFLNAQREYYQTCVNAVDAAL